MIIFAVVAIVAFVVVAVAVVGSASAACCCFCCRCVLLLSGLKYTDVSLRGRYTFRLFLFAFCCFN